MKSSPGTETTKPPTLGGMTEKLLKTHNLAVYWARQSELRMPHSEGHARALTIWNEYEQDFGQLLAQIKDD